MLELDNLDDAQIAQDWYLPARRYLERLGQAEWQHAQRAAKGRRVRYQPSAYHRELIDYLDRNDEHGFKALKQLEGYASALGV